MSDNKGGRPPGSKDRAPVVDIRTARAALKGVKARAKAGSPEDERLLLLTWVYGRYSSGLFGNQVPPLPRTNLYTGEPIQYEPQPITGRTSLLDPPEHVPATVHELRGPDNAA